MIDVYLFVCNYYMHLLVEALVCGTLDARVSSMCLCCIVCQRKLGRLNTGRQRIFIYDKNK